MIRRSVGIVLATAALAVGVTSSAWCVPVATYTSLPTTWEKTSNPNVENCTTHRTCHWTNSIAGQPTGILVGTQAPSNWTLVSIQILNPTLGPLVIGGSTITLTQLPCAPGFCPVDALHPAPPGGQWFEFKSTDIPSGVGDGSLDFTIVTKYDVGDRVAANGKTVSAWVSDDGNARYGNTVIEDFNQGAFIFSAPSLGFWGAIFVALMLLTAGSLSIIRRRRVAVA